MERLSELTDTLLEQQRSLDFVKWLSCLVDRGTPAGASTKFLERWPQSLARPIVTRSLELYTKAAIAAGTTTDSAWANPLVGVAPLVEGFLAIARSASLLGRIPRLRQIPFHARLPVESQGATFTWVGQNALKPVSKFGFASGITLAPTKAMGIIVVTEELAKLSVPGTEGALRDELIAGLTEFTDRSVIDPASTAIPDVRPASITSGTTATASTGDLAKDVGTLLKEFFVGRPGADEAVIVTSPGLKAQLIGPTGGDPYGLPIVTTGAAAGLVVVLDPRGVCVADGGVAIDVSKHAAIVIDDAPVGTAAAIVTDLWGRNLIGFKVERFLNFEAVAGAVKYLAVA